MAKEIERKFLVENTAWRNDVSDNREEIIQGYLGRNPDIRVRMTQSLGYLTIKNQSETITRDEFEYEIPKSEARALLTMCRGYIIEKTRFTIPYLDTDLKWDLDVFKGVNAGLTLAEIEIPFEQYRLQLPEWVGEDVSTDPRYKNPYLSERPYTTW